MDALGPGPDAVDRFVGVIRGLRMHPDAVEEIESHLREVHDELIAAGHDPATAARIAVDRFGAADAPGRRALMRPWRPAGYDLALAAIAALCAFGLSGLIAALVRATAGGTMFIGAVTEEISQRNAQRMAVGACGVVLAAWLWLRRAGPPVRPSSLPALVPWVFFAAGVVFTVVATLDGVLSRDEEIVCLRWASLGVAAAVVAALYRRIRLALWPQERLVP